MFSRRTNWNLTTNRYTEALNQHRQSGREVLDLTASNPTLVELQYREAEIMRSLQQNGAFQYEPVPQGLPLAREAVAGYYAEKSVSVDPENLLLTTGTSEAYSFVFRLLCDPGDCILVPVPSYPLFDFLADLNDVSAIPYELVYDFEWQIDFHSLQSAIERAESGGRRCRAVLIVHPNNPTGSYAKLDEIGQLSQLCGSRDMALIADEVFLDYNLRNSSAPTFAANNTALTFTLSGLSKISALPQMKLAWIATSGPDKLKANALARLEVIADTFLSMNTPIQLATPAMLAERSYIQRQLLERICANLEALNGHLAKQSLCQCLHIEGGWYAVLRVPALGSDEELTVSLLEQTGVLVQPGHFYNFPENGYLIASLIAPRDHFDVGIARLLDFIVNQNR